MLLSTIIQVKKKQLDIALNMTVIVQIHYTSTAKTRGYQKAEIPLKGRNPEMAAYEFWKWIKKQNQIDISLEKVLCEKEDITEMVLELEKQENSRRLNGIDDLPF